MTEKKCCDNCGNRPCGTPASLEFSGVDWCSNEYCCERWQRNPDIRLDILPTEKGWYWTWPVFSGPGVMLDPKIVEIIQDNELLIRQDGEWVPLKSYQHGQWQGPIKPKESK